MEKVYCTDCGWSGSEDELHYKKKKPWSCSEDAICPKCGGKIEYENIPETFPLPLDCANEYFKNIGNVDSMTAYIAGFKTARDMRFDKFDGQWHDIYKKKPPMAPSKE